MRLGVFVQRSQVDEVVRDAHEVAERGFASVWMPQIFDVDAIGALTVVAREVPGLELGTAVVPTYPRHPYVLAAQARTLQQISGGRFTLGIGLSHQIVIEGMLGMSFDRPVRHLREYLEILLPLARGEAVSYDGETLTFRGGLTVPSDPVPVLVAALGTQMLNVTGRRAEGTVTWMTGPATVRDHVAPTIRAAAAEAGRPDPRVVMALPVSVTDDPDGARSIAAQGFEMYGHLPSYRAMLDREGAAGPADVAIVGDAATVREAVAATFDAGATEFVIVPFHERERTLDALAELTG